MSKDIKALLDTVPTPELLKAARERNRKERAAHGRYGAQKKLTLCPKGCGRSFGVRELRDHKRECTGERKKKAA